MSKQNVDSTTLAIVEALRADGDAKALPFNVLLNMASAFAGEVRTQGQLEKFYANTAPEVPDDGTPAKKYPKTQTTPPPAPDAAETEGLESTKESTPEFDLFNAGVVDLLNAGKTLFELGSENQAEVDAARARAFDALQPVREAISIL